MITHLIDWDTARFEERAAWCEILLRQRFNPTLHPEWLDSTLRSWCLTETARVAVIKAGALTRAIIPYIIRRRTILGLPYRVLEPCSNVFSYHAEILADNVEESLDLFLRDRRLPPWDLFRAVNVVSGGSSATAIRSLAKRLGTVLSIRTGEASPYVEITQDWESFLQTRAKKLRANIIRCQRQMQVAGESGMSWYEVGSNAQQLLADMLEIEARSWKQEAGLAIQAGTPQHAYYERLLPWLASNGIMANVLYVKERPVAYTLCAQWNGWVGQLKTSYVSEFRDAGSRVIHSSLERAFRMGHKEYDFLGDTAPHKLRWTETVRSHEDHWLFAAHIRGKVLAGIKKLGDRVHEWRSPIGTNSKINAAMGAE